MKLRSLLPMAAFAALVLTGCSKDDVVAPNQEPTVTEGYATFKINLPSTPGSRAVDYQVEGSPEEYRVNYVKLLIFSKSSSDTEPMFSEAITLNGNNGAPWTDQNGDITVSGGVTARIGKIVEGTEYYVVVLLNGNDLTVPASTSVSYSNWLETTQDESVIGKSSNMGFLMTNATLLNTTDNSISALVKIDTGKIGKTENEAQNNGPAANVYVERVCSKVTIDNGSFNQFDIEGSDNVATITNWDLDITNKKSHAILNTLEASMYTSSGSRYVAPTEFATGYKRLTWGTDHNYDDVTNGDFNILDVNDAESFIGTITNPKYCLENTLSKDQLKKDRATRVVFKATYKLSKLSSAETLYKLTNNATIYTKAEVLNFVKEKAELTLKSANITVEAKDVTTGGFYTLNDVVTIKDNGTVLDDGSLKNVALAMGLGDGVAVKGIGVYIDGVTYYPAYIKHFELDKNEADKTGKYGVVRNNWYELKVTKISAIGEPTRPDTQDPDQPMEPGDIDEEKSYIDVAINILKWAKRTQNVDL